MCVACEEDQTPHGVLLASIADVELGQTDEEGAALGYAENTSWAGKNEWAGKIEGLYVNNPDQYQFWPIWQTFIDNSNGMLVNSSNYQ